MKAILKSEIRKLLTVRSTYVATILAFLFIAFMALYVDGIRNIGNSPAGLGTPHAFDDIVTKIANISIITSLVAILYMAHEYRYNTITYTLTASNSRTKSLLAKMLVVIAYCIFFSLVAFVIGILMLRLGLASRGATLAPQEFDAFYQIGRLIFYTAGNALVSLLFVVLFRNLALSIFMLFFAPSTIEGLLGLLLKENAKYLPFTSLGQVMYSANDAPLSPGKAMMIFSIYLAAGWIITWYLFLRRDAN